MCVYLHTSTCRFICIFGIHKLIFFVHLRIAYAQYRRKALKARTGLLAVIA